MLGAILEIFGQTASPESSWLTYILNGGPFALVVFLFITDRLTTQGERDRLRAELDASHEREEKLNDAIRLDFVPSVTKSLEAIAQSKELMGQVLESLERSFRVIEALEEQLPPKGKSSK